MKALRLREKRDLPRPGQEILYPESDGKPMAETPVHRRQMNYLIDALTLWFSKEKRVYVSGNDFVYYQEGDTRKRVSPDVYVVKGVAPGDRRVYKLWEEKKAPCVVIEVSSKGTKREDIVTKFQLYRDVLRVKEYYIYDPLREYLHGRLQAWELTGGKYEDRRVTGQHVASRELGLILADTERYLRLVDPKTGTELPDFVEANAHARAAQATCDSETRMRLEAEAEVRRLRDEVRRMKRGRRAR